MPHWSLRAALAAAVALLAVATATEASPSTADKYMQQDAEMTPSSSTDGEPFAGSSRPASGAQIDWPKSAARGTVTLVLPMLGSTEATTVDVVDNLLIFDGDVVVGGYDEENRRAFLQPNVLIERSDDEGEGRRLGAKFHQGRWLWPEGKVRSLCMRPPMAIPHIIEFGLGSSGVLLA